MTTQASFMVLIALLILIIAFIFFRKCRLYKMIIMDKQSCVDNLNKILKRVSELQKK